MFGLLALCTMSRTPHHPSPFLGLRDVQVPWYAGGQWSILRTLVYLVQPCSVLLETWKDRVGAEVICQWWLRL